MKEKVDILAFGAHPDDVEIGMAGSLSKWANEGKKIVICDLTEAELSSNGDVTSRKLEAKKAAEIIGVMERINLQLPDRGLFNEPKSIQKIVNVIRKYKPTLIFSPFEEDRHPDHGNCTRLVREAFFSAGIRKYETENRYDAHKPSNHFLYFINGFSKPDFLVDITKDIDQKIKSLEAYKSQFYINDNGVTTPLTEGYIDSVIARERLLGKEVGVTYAEGFKADRPLLINKDIFGKG